MAKQKIAVPVQGAYADALDFSYEALVAAGRRRVKGRFGRGEQRRRFLLVPEQGLTQQWKLRLGRIVFAASLWSLGSADQEGVTAVDDRAWRKM
jgi:hypothetical protein